MKKLTLLLAIIAVIFASCSESSTAPEGNGDDTTTVYKDTIFWQSVDSPILVNGIFEVSDTTTLFIEPGTRIEFSTGDTISSSGLLIHGSICANGTVDDSIVFTRHGSSGNWGSIGLYYADFGENSFMNCRFEHSSSNYVDSLGFSFNGLDFIGSDALVQSCRFSSAGYNLVCEHLSEVNVNECQFMDGDGVLAYNASLNMDYCTFQPGYEAEAIIQFRKAYNSMVQNTAFKDLICSRIIYLGAGYDNVAVNYCSFESVCEYGIYIGGCLDAIVYGNTFAPDCFSSAVFSDNSITSLSNCLIDRCEYSGIYSRQSLVKLRNCTIVNNTSGSGLWSVDREYNPIIINTIFYNNYNSIISYYWPAFCWSCSFDDIFNAEMMVDQSGNLFENDPIFAAPLEGNYTLSQNSPCIDAGTDYFPLPLTDITGSDRINGETVDMGAFEFVE